MPISIGECQVIFKLMLKSCKYSKLHEVNFKILAWVLLMPKILAKIREKSSLVNCCWCGEEANLEHIILMCKLTRRIHHCLVIDNSLPDGLLKGKAWVFGVKGNWNSLIWVVNFVIYKAHLCACHNYHKLSTLV